MREKFIQAGAKATVESQAEQAESTLVVVPPVSPLFSVELCPGRSIQEIHLAALCPRFCSVTWHPTPSGQPEAFESIPALQLAGRLRTHGHEVLLHLAGRNLKKYQVLNLLDRARKAGIGRIFALQGDPSRIMEQDDSKCDFPYAADLVRFIKSYYQETFTIGVAGYPDCHPKSKSISQDIDYLKHKVSCGADFIITQASYSYSSYENFVKICRYAGIHVPIIPGMFLVKSYKSLLTISEFCGVPIPSDVIRTVSNNKENSEAVLNFGVDFAVELARKFLNRKDLYENVHFFCLNDLTLVERVIKTLRIYEEHIERPIIVELESLYLKYSKERKRIDRCGGS